VPYIRKARRDAVHEGGAITYGELNYELTTRILEFLSSHPTYEEFQAVIGLLECMKQEFYRRMVAPYEDKKKEENGDVF
jgi:hypothetical protein